MREVSDCYVCPRYGPVSSFSELENESVWKTVLQSNDKLSNVQAKMGVGVGDGRTISSKSDPWKFRFTKDHLPSLEVGLRDNYQFYLKRHQRTSLNHKPTKCNQTWICILTVICAHGFPGTSWNEGLLLNQALTRYFHLKAISILSLIFAAVLRKFLLNASKYNLPSS